VLQVVGLNLEVDKHRHYFGDRNLRLGLNQVEQARDVFLKIELDLDGLEAGAVLLPGVFKRRVGDAFELIYLLEEVVHLLHRLLEQQLLRVLLGKEVKLDVVATTKDIGGLAKDVLVDLDFLIFIRA